MWYSKKLYGASVLHLLVYVLFLREAVKTNIANIPIQCLYLTHNALKYERHYTPLPQTKKKIICFILEEIYTKQC